MFLNIFGSVQLLGGFHNPQVASPQVERWPVIFPGLSGEGEIVGRPKGRDVYWECWVYPFPNRGAALDMMTALDGIQGQHGTVTEVLDDSGPISYDHCTLVDVQRLQIREQPGPYYSAGGTVANAWFFPVGLLFRQLLAYAQEIQG